MSWGLAKWNEVEIFKFEKDMDIYIQKSQRIPNRFNQHKLSPKYTIVKFWKVKDKERILRKEIENSQVTHKEKPIRLVSTPWEKRVEWYTLSLKKKKSQKEIIPTKAILSIWRKVKAFSRKSRSERTHHQISLTRDSKWSPLLEINMQGPGTVSTGVKAIALNVPGSPMCSNQQRQ